MKNIFVGNLSFNSTEESIRSLFERYGVVNSARIMTDRDTGRSRGFAFVEMENEGEADQAITALNGSSLDGRSINVNEARPKPDRGFGGGAAAAAIASAGAAEVVAGDGPAVVAVAAAAVANRAGNRCGPTSVTSLSDADQIGAGLWVELWSASSTTHCR